jgi:hypothetical protein
MNEAPAMPETPCCGNCPYWMETPAAGTGVPRLANTAPIRNGICRRFPPQLLMVGFGQSPIAKPGLQQQAAPMMQAMFPPMTEFGWCGEHPLSHAARFFDNMLPVQQEEQP